jgi:uncharacterized protein DUF6538
MPLPAYLRRRGHTWFFRLKWPSRLAPYQFSGELIRSLKTSDFHIARRRALTLVVKIETMTSSVDIPKKAEVESAVRRWIDERVWLEEIRRAETGGLDFLERGEVEKMDPGEGRELDCLFRFAWHHLERAAIVRALTGGEPTERHRSIVADAAIAPGADNGRQSRPL